MANKMRKKSDCSSTGSTIGPPLPPGSVNGSLSSHGVPDMLHIRMKAYSRREARQTMERDIKRLASRLQDDTDAAQRIARDFHKEVKAVEQENDYLRRLLHKQSSLPSPVQEKVRSVRPSSESLATDDVGSSSSGEEQVVDSQNWRPFSSDNPLHQSPSKSEQEVRRRSDMGAVHMGVLRKNSILGLPGLPRFSSPLTHREKTVESAQPSKAPKRTKSRDGAYAMEGRRMSEQQSVASTVLKVEAQPSSSESEEDTQLSRQDGEPVKSEPDLLSSGKDRKLSSLFARSRASTAAFETAICARRQSQPSPPPSEEAVNGKAFIATVTSDGRICLSHSPSDAEMPRRHSVQSRVAFDNGTGRPSDLIMQEYATRSGRRGSRCITVGNEFMLQGELASMTAGEGVPGQIGVSRRESRALTDYAACRRNSQESNLSLNIRRANMDYETRRTDAVVNVDIEDDHPAQHQTPSRPRPTFEVLDIWMQNEPEKVKNVFSTRTITMDTGALSKRSKTTSLTFNPHPAKGKCVVQPNGVKRLSWDMFSLFLIVYDCITIPLAFFDPAPTTFTTTFQWIIRIFWTLDLGASLCTGYVQPDGTIEMRRRPIAVRYVRTWLSLDVVLVAIDWIDLQKDYGDDKSHQSMGFARSMKTARTFRILRMTRLLRLLRLQKVISMMSERIRSERLILVYDITKIMVMVIGATHVVACVWYGISANSEFGDATWVVVSEVRHKSLGDRYAMSVHWSLAHVSGFGFDEVHPQNISERVFAILVLFITFVMASSFLSTLTSSMTRLHIVTSRESGQFMMLRRYLTENEISQDLSLRVQRNATHRLMEHQKITPEDEVKLLTLVSLPLKQEMHFELHSPVLGTHQFLKHYCSVCPAVMGKVCHTAVHSRIFTSEDMCFTQGDSSDPQMYFNTQGRLEYTRDELTARSLPKGDWCCEPTLWTTWMHRGSLRSLSECRMLVLDARKFQDIVSQFVSPEINPHLYAVNYVAALNELDQEELDDLTVVQQPDWDWCLCGTSASGRSSQQFAPFRSHVLGSFYLPQIHLANPLSFLSQMSCESREDHADNNSNGFADINGNPGQAKLRRTKSWGL